MDKIYIRDLAFRCIIGVYPEERREKQDVIINIELDCDHSRAVQSDCINDAVDYKRIKKEIRTLVEESQYNLIEALAGSIADICLQDKGVQQVKVTVDKPGALRFARSVAVELTRKQG